MKHGQKVVEDDDALVYSFKKVKRSLARDKMVGRASCWLK